VSAAWTRWNLSSYRWLIYRETDLKIHFCVLHASLLPFKPSLSFLNQAKKKKERNQRVIYKKKKFYITSPLNTRKCCPKRQHPLIIQSFSHEMDSKWEEQEKRHQPIKSTWWRTVMIRKELEEMGVTWSKAQAKAQDDRLKVPRFYCGLLSQLGWGGWVSECFNATFEKLWSPSLCSQNLQLLSLANIP